MTVPRCPVCQAARVIIVLGDSRRGLCSSCGARWIQDGAVQRRIEVPEPAHPRAPRRRPSVAR